LRKRNEKSSRTCSRSKRRTRRATGAGRNGSRVAMAMTVNSVLRLPGHARPGECSTDVLARAPGPAARSVQNARPPGSDEKLAADEAALRPVGQPDHEASVQADVVDRPGQGLATLDGANDLLSPPEARQ